MTAGWVLLLFLLALGALDLLVLLGWTADSRDPRYGIGPVLRPWRAPTDSRRERP
jgi:hypothetical protein